MMNEEENTFFPLLLAFSSSSHCSTKKRKRMASSADPRKAYPNPQEIAADKTAAQKPPGGSEAALPKKGAFAPNFGLDSYRGSGKLQGLSAIVTVADSGIGRAVALAFSREGCASLVLTSLDSSEEKEDLAGTVSAIEEQGSAPGERGAAKVAVVSGDLSDESFRVAVVEDAGEKIGASLCLSSFSSSSSSSFAYDTESTCERQKK